MPLADQTELGRAARRASDGHAAAPLVRRRFFEATTFLRRMEAQKLSAKQAARQMAAKAITMPHIFVPSSSWPSFRKPGNGVAAERTGGRRRERAGAASWLNSPGASVADTWPLRMPMKTDTVTRGVPLIPLSCGWGWALSSHSGSFPCHRVSDGDVVVALYLR